MPSNPTFVEQTIGAEPPANGEGQSGSHSRSYLLFLLLLTLIPWPLPFLLVRLPGFERWSGSAHGSKLEFAFTASNINADIVIFGDSSALFGIDPVQIGTSLGVKAVNLPNTASSLAVTDDMPLRRYLGTNTRPKLIVFYFTPWNLNYKHTLMMAALYEGEEMLVRHGTLRENLVFWATHPSELLQFPFRFYSSNRVLSSRASLKPGAIEGSLGHVAIDEALTQIGNPCQFPPGFLRKLPVDSVRELGARYRTPQTAVLFFVAPVPACTNAAALSDLRYRQLPAAPPRQMPPGDFQADGYYAHLHAASVPDATASLIEAIRPALAAPQAANRERCGFCKHPRVDAFSRLSK